MSVKSAMSVSGLLFWLIIITSIASNQFGYQTADDLEAEADLERIGNDPREFGKNRGLALPPECQPGRQHLRELRSAPGNLTPVR